MQLESSSTRLQSHLCLSIYKAKVDRLSLLLHPSLIPTLYLWDSMGLNKHASIYALPQLTLDPDPNTAVPLTFLGVTFLNVSLVGAWISNRHCGDNCQMPS